MGHFKRRGLKLGDVSRVGEQSRTSPFMIIFSKVPSEAQSVDGPRLNVLKLGLHLGGTDALDRTK